MYIAKHYTRINGKLYTRGEVVPDELPGEKKKWLLSKGAIEEVAPALTFTQDEEEVKAEENDYPESPDEVMDEEETEVNDNAPEINALDGIVGAEEPKKKPARRKAK